MELKEVQKIVEQTLEQRNRAISNYDEALRYYENRNDITKRNAGKSKMNKDGKEEPLRNADNRISSNYYQLLVDQEAGYLATQPPQIDVGTDQENQKVSDVLGDDFALKINNLVVDASNAGRAWLHYWIDKDGTFRYGIVPPNQITPIYSTNLDNKLLGVLRSYKQLDDDTGKYFIVHEFWNDKEAMFFKESSATPLQLEPYATVPLYDVTAGYSIGMTDHINHNFGRVPFIGFQKNKLCLSELHKVKGLIDAYDDVYNGFLNDVDDIQQVILVLKNYGATNLNDFMDELKNKKVVKFNNAGNGDQSGVDTLQIDIPVEARDTILKMTKSDIFLQGQGVDPANFQSTNASGVAIKMLYSHLELKASNTEAYFRRGISELIRAVMNYLNFSNADSRLITQTWTRTKVEDDLSQAQVVSQVASFTSKEAIAKANPIVEDWQQELQDQKKDIQESDGFRSSQSFEDYGAQLDDQDNEDAPDKSEQANKKPDDD
ncbi:MULTISPECIES: phage portal protein [Lactobacillus]|uniref:phage portal protein n=1 Tax=Lactobacillus TaxID=1578 RepID=UPI000CD9D0A5|nr:MULTISPECIES: phage portal protein [Lactobacillus]RVU73605.1 phage portal protein [Lactobacillus xujianguonis]